MAKKHKHEEHENLERWLVSYGDFITLLFATFVVLYALAQVDASDFVKLEESLKYAFQQNALLDGQESIMSGDVALFDQQYANSFIPSLMVEYISPKYEEESFSSIYAFSCRQYICQDTSRHIDSNHSAADALPRL